MLIRCWVMVRVPIKLGVGGFATACTRPAEVNLWVLVLASWGRDWDGSGSLVFFIRVLFPVIVFWLGSISPYSVELGLGQITGLWSWCLFRRRVGLYSVYFYGQFAYEHSLHMDWYDWDMVPSRVFVFLAVVYGVLSRFSEGSVLCNLWKEVIDWLEFGLVKLMVPVTIFGVRSYVPPVVCIPMI